MLVLFRESSFSASFHLAYVNVFYYSKQSACHGDGALQVATNLINKSDGRSGSALSRLGDRHKRATCPVGSARKRETPITALPCVEGFRRTWRDGSE